MSEGSASKKEVAAGELLAEKAPEEDVSCLTIEDLDRQSQYDTSLTDQRLMHARGSNSS